MNLFSNFHKSVGVDLGTANFLVYLKGEGIIVNEPSLVALNTRTNQVLAIGEAARKMLDRTPSHVSLIKPLVNGVISDFETTAEMLKYFLRPRSNNSFLYRYRLAAISIPTNLTEVESPPFQWILMSLFFSLLTVVVSALMHGCKGDHQDEWLKQHHCVRIGTSIGPPWSFFDHKPNQDALYRCDGDSQ
jgi:hypothetical protein